MDEIKDLDKYENSTSPEYPEILRKGAGDEVDKAQRLGELEKRKILLSLSQRTYDVGSGVILKQRKDPTSDPQNSQRFITEIVLTNRGIFKNIPDGFVDGTPVQKFRIEEIPVEEYSQFGTLAESAIQGLPLKDDSK
jgi:hypothetical protein